MEYDKISSLVIITSLTKLFNKIEKRREGVVKEDKKKHIILPSQVL